MATSGLITEVLFSIDIETDGPIPGKYSMLSLGACVVGESGNPIAKREFYIELQPIQVGYDPEAYQVAKQGGLDRFKLMVDGVEAATAMRSFHSWIAQHVDLGSNFPLKPIFVGFNAAFDWQFVNWYFHTYLGENPFGFKPLDICAFAVGALGLEKLKDTGDTNLRRLLGLNPPRNAHHALADAKEQAELLEALQRKAKER